MQRKQIALLLFLLIYGAYVQAQDVYAAQRPGWIQKAEGYKPTLDTTLKSPVGVVQVIQDEASFQNVKARHVNSVPDLNKLLLKKDSSFVLDFGTHLVGYLQFFVKADPGADAPLQLRLTFGEVPLELSASFDDYKGSLSKAWLQQEVITIDVMPDTVRLPRRYAFRYVKVETLSASAYYTASMGHLRCKSVTSADKDAFGAAPVPNDFKTIQDVSLLTLKNCMQTVFEDGPKRDRRLWIGDLKLQALASYYSFQDTALVKRCLYALAATAHPNGLLYGTLFEKPMLHPQQHHPIDYCLLFNSTLADFYAATKDLKTAAELWPVALQQVQHAIPQINKEGLFELSKQWWVFVDWNEQLDKTTALQGIVTFCLQETYDLAKQLGRESDVRQLPALIAKMKAASRRYLFDKKLQLFVSGKDRQVSTASQVWMVLSKTVFGTEAAKVMASLGKTKQVLKPVSPYLYHYLVEAYCTTGMYNNARFLLSDYWGGMIRKGADTFWEVYDPTNDFLSPYNSAIINSYCHAWSCTPVYFLRKYGGALFQAKALKAKQ
jgi:hypothetical protein